MSVAVSAALFAVVIFSLPNLFKASDDELFVLNLICRSVAVFLAVYAARACGFKLFSKRKLTVFEVFSVILGFLVCLNNFPIIGFIAGRVTLIQNARIVRYVVYCIAIGVSEEFVFRGFVFPLVGLKVRNKPRAPFLAVLISSAVFAFCHLFNIFSAGFVPTMLQVGYTFLTGGLFGAVYLFIENLIYPVIMHILFDIGGLMFSETFGIAAGNMWDMATITITAVLGVIATAVYVYKLLKYGTERDQK